MGGVGRTFGRYFLLGGHVFSTVREFGIYFCVMGGIFFFSEQDESGDQCGVGYMIVFCSWGDGRNIKRYFWVGGACPHYKGQEGRMFLGNAGHAYFFWATRIV